MCTDSTAFLSKGCVLGQPLSEGKQSAHSKDRRRDEEPLIAWAQPVGQAGGHIFLMTSPGKCISEYFLFILLFLKFNITYKILTFA